MEKQKLTFKQRIAYAHWTAKVAFRVPYFGWLMALCAGVIYLGIALWFFDPEIKALRDYSGAHGLGKAYFAILAGLLVIIALSYVTVYIPYFIQAYFDNDQNCRRIFLKYYYQKH